MATKGKIFEALLAGLEFDSVTLSGGKVYFCIPGGTISDLKSVWLDRDKTTPAANPYTVDSDGRAEIFGDGVYDIVVKTATLVTKATWTNVSLVDAVVPAAITADVTGNLTGDVTGDVTGNLNGDVTGNVTGDVTGNLNTYGTSTTPTASKIPVADADGTLNSWVTQSNSLPVRQTVVRGGVDASGFANFLTAGTGQAATLTASAAAPVQIAFAAGFDAHGAVDYTKVLTADQTDFWTGIPASVSGVTITRSGQTATATKTSHGFLVGQMVTLSGAGQSEYNQTFTILTVPTSNTFTFSVVGTPATPSTGTIVAAPITFLYVDYNTSTGAITSAMSTNPPVYSMIAPSAPVAPQQWFDMNSMQMKQYTGSAWTVVTRVCVGEVVGGAAAPSVVTAYAINGMRTITGAVLSASQTQSFAHAIGRLNPASVGYALRCVIPDNDWNIGDEVKLFANYLDVNNAGATTVRSFGIGTDTAKVYTVTSGASLYLPNKTSSGHAVSTFANWLPVLYVKRGW